MTPHLIKGSILRSAAKPLLCSDGADTGNFSRLEAHSLQLAKLGRLAERYFAVNPPTALVKLHQFAEITAKEVAARQALLPDGRASFDPANAFNFPRRDR